MSDETSKTNTGTNTDGTTDAPPEKFGRRARPTINVDAAKVRTTVARIIWGVCVLFAGVLAAAVLLIAIDARFENDLVRFIFDFAANVDLGFFDLTSPIKDFDVKVISPFADTKTALFNYGICAIVWLVIGRVLERVVRP